MNTLNPSSSIGADGTGTSTLKANGVSKGSATASRSAVSTEVHGFFADIEDLIKSATSLTGEEIGRAKAQLMERVNSAKLAAEQMSHVVADKARESAKATDVYVHEQPWRAIGIGAAAGLLIGLMLFRGSKK